MTEGLGGYRARHVHGKSGPLCPEWSWTPTIRRVAGNLATLVSATG